MERHLVSWLVTSYFSPSNFMVIIVSPMQETQQLHLIFIFSVIRNNLLIESITF